MRRALTASLVVIGLAATAAPAGAVNANVQALDPDDTYATPGRFSAAAVQINPGEKVTWTLNGIENHNVVFEDGLFTSPAVPMNPWPGVVERTFPVAGLYRYYCAQHVEPVGGMRGTVQVGPPATPPPGGGGRTPGTGTAPPTGTPPAVKIDSASVTRRRFCNRRSARCNSPGIRIRVDLSVDSRLTGVLRRRPLTGPGASRRFGTLDFGTVDAGPRRLAFRRTKTGRRLGKGRYSLTLKAGLDTEVVRFRVTR